MYFNMRLQETYIFLLMNIVLVTSAREPSCPACSRYDFEERLLERVLRNELVIETMLKETRENNIKVESALKLMHADKSLLEDTLNSLEKSKTDMNADLQKAITTAMTNISSAVSEMTQNASITGLQLKKETKILKDQLTIPSIYFHAHTPADCTLNAGQDIIYTNVRVNEGQGYDPNTGRFTVAVPGLYAFTVHYIVHSSTYVGLEIIHQGTRMQPVFLRPGSGNEVSSSMQVFIRTNRADQIWVKSTHSSSQLHNDDTYNSFSGTLVHM